MGMLAQAGWIISPDDTWPAWEARGATLVEQPAGVAEAAEG